MLTFEINSPEVKGEYLECINLCFGNWGDAAAYHWYFERKTSFHAPDLMVLKKDGEIVAGSAVTYRRLALANGELIDVGIMTGSWTLPAARWQGCFTRIIEESRRLTHEMGGALLLAFVTEENASARRLADAGCALAPSVYFFSTPETPYPEDGRDLNPVEKDEPVIAALYDELYVGNKHYVNFVYSTARDFGAQFIRRVIETEVLSDGEGITGVVEKKPDTDSLLLIPPDDEPDITRYISAFLKHALGDDRKLFFFSTRPAVIAAAERLGMGTKPGYVTVLAADTDRLQAAFGMTEAWPGEMGLTHPGTPWFLGEWRVQNGDRA